MNIEAGLPINDWRKVGAAAAKAEADGNRVSAYALRPDIANHGLAKVLAGEVGCFDVGAHWF